MTQHIEGHNDMSNGQLLIRNYEDHQYWKDIFKLLKEENFGQEFSFQGNDSFKMKVK